ncbi:MAG: hypothetical protein HQL57_11690, partial [Magnetococcales bacterium]|nr:hypothetical protein [Magnetococcales bacterium]
MEATWESGAKVESESLGSEPGDSGESGILGSEPGSPGGEGHPPGTGVALDSGGGASGGEGGAVSTAVRGGGRSPGGLLYEEHLLAPGSDSPGGDHTVASGESLASVLPPVSVPSALLLRSAPSPALERPASRSSPTAGREEGGTAAASRSGVTAESVAEEGSDAPKGDVFPSSDDHASLVPGGVGEEGGGPAAISRREGRGE